MSAAHSIKPKDPRTTHGHASTDGKGTPSKTYTAWRSMISRCTLPSYRGFHRYGGRGIKICERWMGEGGFEAFLSDMGVKPAGTTLDRRENNEGYSPENCRWATPKEQALNRCDNTLLTFRGRTQALVLWAREVGIQYGTLIARLREGWSAEDALTRPVQKRRVKT